MIYSYSKQCIGKVQKMFKTFLDKDYWPAKNHHAEQSFRFMKDGKEFAKHEEKYCSHWLKICEKLYLHHYYRRVHNVIQVEPVKAEVVTW